MRLESDSLGMRLESDSLGMRLESDSLGMRLESDSLGMRLESDSLGMRLESDVRSLWTAPQLDCPRDLYFTCRQASRASSENEQRWVGLPHHCSSFVAVSWAFSDVGDWMMNPLSTNTACTAIVNS